MPPRSSWTRSSLICRSEPWAPFSELSTIHRVKAKTPQEKRLQAKEAGRDNKAGYLFLLPWLIGLVVITIGPMLASLYLSFTNYSLIQAPR